MLRIYLGFIKYKYFFYIKEILIIYIDYKLLIYFLKVIKLNKIYVKWAMEMYIFNIEIEYIFKSKNKITNILF